MIEIQYLIAPIFVLIVLGHLLRRGGIPDTEFWNLNDRLVYWVLMPSLLFYKTSTIELSFDLIGSFATVVLGAFACAMVFSLVTGRLAKMGGPVTTSIMQGAARHNTFIALAVAESLYGLEGLALAALITAVLIPVTNLTVVPFMVILLDEDKEQGFGDILVHILQELARNPLLIAVAAGISLNLSGIGKIPVLHETTNIIGSAALPIVLMCVGANIRLRAMQASTVPVLISSVGKLVLFPVIIVVLSQLIGLSDQETLVAVLFGAVPTTAGAYTLARQMGGDAPLMAAIVTIQTCLSFITLPLTIEAVRWFLA